MRIQVNDFMTTTVVTAEGTNTVGEVRTMMKRHGIHAIPIVEHIPNGELNIRGIITATDLCMEVNDSVPLDQVMLPTRVHVIPSNTGVRSAAKNMLRHEVHHLVVMEDGKIIGMISSQDFVKLVARYELDVRTDAVA